VLLTEPPFRGYRGAQPDAIQRSERSRAWTLQGGIAARRVIDLHDILGDGAGRIRPEYDGGDGLHPNREGRVAIARAIAGGGA
jgi:lysophospholipase L1-like esterase